MPKGNSGTKFEIPKGWQESYFFFLYAWKYHPGGFIELREKVQELNGSKPGNQCIYDSCGKLLTSIYPKHSAGTVDWYSPGLFGADSHYLNDVEPFKWAKLIDRIQYYYKVRPHIWLDPTGRKRINDDLFEIGF